MPKPETAPVTVVIPVYNRAHIVERTLRSLDSQTVRPEAVVLVDNNSADASLSILRKWAASRAYATVATESTPGACAARNCGLALVRTPFVMFFDSDDEMLPNHVADFAAAIASHPGADIFGRDVLSVCDGVPERRHYFTARNAMFNHLFRGTLSTARIVARTKLVRQVGGWSTSLGGWDDFELGVRLLLGTDKEKVVDIGGEPSVHVHHTAESITGNSFSENPGRWEKSLAQIRADLREAGRADLEKWVDARIAILAAQYAREGSMELANGLMKQLADSPSGSKRIRRLRLLYHHNRLFNRLTWVVAKIIL